MTPRVKHALQLAGWYVLQSLTSVYAMVFCAVALAVAVLVRPGEWAGKRAGAVLPLFMLAGGIAVIALLPFMWPYLQARRELEMFGRTLPEIAKYSASFTDYLATGGRIHNSTWSGQYFRNDGLFPGIVGFGLALVAMFHWCGVEGSARAHGPGLRRCRLRLVVWSGVSALRSPLQDISADGRCPGRRAMGTDVSRGRRAPCRLRDGGAAAARRRAWALPLSLALVIVANVEALRAPIAFTADDHYGGVPAIFKTLDTPEPEVVIIFPFYPPRDISMNARYMLVSTAFWKPMVNGYSGYMPTRYITHTQNLGGFPDARSLQYLKEIWRDARAGGQPQHGTGRTRAIARLSGPDAPEHRRQPSYLRFETMTALLAAACAGLAAWFSIGALAVTASPGGELVRWACCHPSGCCRC